MEGKFAWLCVPSPLTCYTKPEPSTYYSIPSTACNIWLRWIATNIMMESIDIMRHSAGLRSMCLFYFESRSLTTWKTCILVFRYGNIMWMVFNIHNIPRLDQFQIDLTTTSWYKGPTSTQFIHNTWERTVGTVFLLLKRKKNVLSFAIIVTF